MGRLEKIEEYKGTIELLSGLMIGDSNADIKIGGLDKDVIKHPITGEPFIPGSSLKGKIRSLLESRYGRISQHGKRDEKGFATTYSEAYIKDGKTTVDKDKGEPCQCGKPNCVICKLFGAHKNTSSQVAPPRLLFRDCMISKESRDYVASQQIEKRDFYEIKAENSINRLYGTAASPRFMERVVAGMKFDFSVVLQEYDVDDVDDVKKLKKTVEEGIRMLENSYLGARGSAGNGQVKFNCEWKEVK